jgi:cyclic beta-1,2-glucan synthetase
LALLAPLGSIAIAFQARASTGRWPSAALALIDAAAAAQAGLWAQVFLVTGVALDALKGRRPTRYAAGGHLTSGITKGAVNGGLFLLLQGAAMLAALSGTVALWQAAPLLTATLVGALLFPLARTLVESFDGNMPFFHRLATNAREPWGYARGAVIGVDLAVGIGLPGGSDGARFGYGLALGMLAYAGIDLARDGWQMVRPRIWVRWSPAHGIRPQSCAPIDWEAVAEQGSGR